MDTTTTLQVRCLPINHAEEATGDVVFSVDVPLDCIIDEFKEKIKEMLCQKLDNIAVNELTVWRCKGKGVGTEKSSDLKKRVSRFNFSDESGDVESVGTCALFESDGDQITL